MPAQAGTRAAWFIICLQHTRLYLFAAQQNGTILVGILPEAEDRI